MFLVVTQGCIIGTSGLVPVYTHEYGQVSVSPESARLNEPVATEKAECECRDVLQLLLFTVAIDKKKYDILMTLEGGHWLSSKKAREHL